MQSDFQEGQEIFLFSKMFSYQVSHPATYTVSNGDRGFLLSGIKKLEQDTGQWPSSSAVINNVHTAIRQLTITLLIWYLMKHRDTLNPQRTELNAICKSQLAELFCRVFKFCTWYSKNKNISRTKQDKFVKQKAVCVEGIRHCSGFLKIL